MFHADGPDAVTGRQVEQQSSMTSDQRPDRPPSRTMSSSSKEIAVVLPDEIANSHLETPDLGTAGGDQYQAEANGHGPEADRVIRWATTGSVVMLALIAAVVSYRHMYTLVLRHGETVWTAALLPLSVDGMIAASSMSLLVDSRHGRRGGVLPWTLLIVGSAASLAANVAVAEPSWEGRLIAAWPSFALIGSYELLMRQIRFSATPEAVPNRRDRPAAPPFTASGETPVIADPERSTGEVSRIVPRRPRIADLRRRAWAWAEAHRGVDGRLPTGEQIARQFGRSPRWGRLVKEAGTNGQLS
jgi:hypothetical protein